MIKDIIIDLPLSLMEGNNINKYISRIELMYNKKLMYIKNEL